MGPMKRYRKIALVTGGNRGLGYETCRRLAREGAIVLLGSRRLRAGRKAAEALQLEVREGGGGGEVHVVKLDVTRPKEIVAAARWIAEEYGRLDILVNNAGVYLDEGVSVFDVDEVTFRRTMNVNFQGPFRLCRALVGLLRAAPGGRIVNLTSGYGSMSRMSGGTAAYRVSKTSLNALTRILAAELADTSIKVNAVDPGWVRTDMGGPSATLSPEEAVETVLWLALLEDDGPTGGLFYNGEPAPW